MVEVVTVWSPRPNHEKWRDDYIDLLHLQRKTALRFRHRHTVMTDAWIHGFDTIHVPLPESVMQAMIVGVIERLKRAGDDDLLFLDVDALVGREVDKAFDRSFDIGLTRRPNDIAPINNGAMYVDASAVEKVIPFFEHALELCGDHWGADQEAISAAASPVPEVEGVEVRDGVRFAFLSMLTHNCIPKAEGQPHKSSPYVVHFKGGTKPWAQTYARKYLGLG